MHLRNLFSTKYYKNISFSLSFPLLGCFEVSGIGLSIAKGEWILFADSDDFFTYCFNEILDDCYSIDDGVDLVFFPACSLDSVTYTNTNRAQHLKKMIDGLLK